MSEQNLDIDLGEAVGRPLVDKVLLALIDAHPNPNLARSPASQRKEREDRLSQAKAALFGQSRSVGAPNRDRNSVLRWMGEESRKDTAVIDARKMYSPNDLPVWALKKKGWRARSAKQLAEEAVERFGLPGSESDRLRHKFKNEAAKWHDIAHYSDDVADTLEFALIENIAKAFASAGISTCLNNLEKP